MLRENPKNRIKDLPKIERPREKYKGMGHRKRLRKRFLQAGLDGFLDYEVIELLLTLGTPRKDCKQQAKEVLKKFGSLQGVFEASTQELQRIKGIGPENIFGIKLFQALSERFAREKIPKKILLDSSEAVDNYLKKKIGESKKENFYILALDAKNNLINIQEISVGTLTASIVHPREVFKEAIRSSAASIILAHNHPSGDAEPSEADLEITKRLIEVGKIVGIEVLDHLIITKAKTFAFKEKKLI